MGWVVPGLIILCILALLFISYLVLIGPSRKNKKEISDLFQVLFAHRGLYTPDQSPPENSIPSFRAARDRGYGIEFDLILTKDGKVIVFHDEYLMRACKVQGRVEDYTYEELQKFRLFGTKETIPLFVDVLECINGKVFLLIEFKSTSRYRELCQAAATLLDDYPGKFCIESFNPIMVKWFYKNRPGYIRGQLSMGIQGYRAFPYFERFILSCFLTNILCRPHFVAYRHEDSHKRTVSLKLFRLLGGSLVGWTVSKKEDEVYCLKFFRTIIFEFIYK